jgi:GntR family transcriptional regulator, rspAB operon transcriptional repressor
MATPRHLTAERLAERARPSSFHTKTDYALVELRRLIVTGVLAPGERLDLQVLADALGISRMPLREALSRLAAQGLVEIHPQRWTSVAPLSRADIVDTYGARHELETLLAGQAGGRLDDERVAEIAQELERQRLLADADDLEGVLRSDRRFHDLLYERAGMPRTHGLVSGLRDVADRYIYLFLEDGSDRRRSIAEHQEIVRLCHQRQTAALRDAVGEHVARGRDALLAKLEREGNGGQRDHRA